MWMLVNHLFNRCFILLFQVLSQLSGDLDYGSLQNLMSSHLPYIIQQWLKQDYDLAQFPYQLAGFKLQQDFYRYDELTYHCSNIYVNACCSQQVNSSPHFSIEFAGA